MRKSKRQNGKRDLKPLFLTCFCYHDESSNRCGSPTSSGGKRPCRGDLGELFVMLGKMVRTQRDVSPCLPWSLRPRIREESIREEPIE